jgi:LPS sulfotransferase NodH
LLCEILKNTHLAGYPEEYFDALKSTGVPQRPLEYFTGITDEALVNILKDRNYPDEEQRQPPPGISFESYVHSIIERCISANGVFGTKMMWNYFPDFISKLRDIPRYHELSTPSLLATFFPNLHYIFVTRRDKLGQAVSLWKGIQTWIWRAENTSIREGEKKAAHELSFHFGAIDHLVQLVLRVAQTHDVSQKSQWRGKKAVAVHHVRRSQSWGRPSQPGIPSQVQLCRNQWW